MDEQYQQFDTKLFSWNQGQSFAAYLEADGYREQEAMLRPNVHTYSRLLPRIVQMAQRLLVLIPQKDQWGWQREGGGWITETNGQVMACGRFPSGEPRTRQGQSLRLQNLIKHLVGKHHAVGTTDATREGWVIDGAGSYERAYSTVIALRVDVDQDSAWRNERSRDIILELMEERSVAYSLGLPFTAFRTGRRGFQAVMPLPCQTSHCIASLLLTAFREILEARRFCGAEVDKDNLHGLMRLPGGLHANNGNLGLWIDIDGECLYPLALQARLMTRAFRFLPDLAPDTDVWEPQEFLQASEEVSAYLTTKRVPPHTRLNPEQSAAVRKALPANDLIQRIELAWNVVRAQNATQQATTDHTRHTSFLSPSEAPAENDLTVSFPISALPTTASQVTPDFVPDVRKDRTPTRYTVEWASRVWQEGFQPGGFWAWLHMGEGGVCGILAAVILFGKDRAEQALQDKATETPAATAIDCQERTYTIKSAWKSFKLKDFTPFDSSMVKTRPLMVGEISADVSELARAIVTEMECRQPKHRWRVEIAEQVVLLLLLLLKASGTGIAEVSYRTLANTVNRQWREQHPHAEDDFTNHMRVKEVILRLTPGDACLYAMLQTFGGAYWKRQPNLYLAGRELLLTPFGEACQEKYFEYLAAEVLSDESTFEDEIEESDMPLSSTALCVIEEE